MKKIYIFDRRSLELSEEEYETDEELEEIYESCDDSPMICGTLFLTEEEVEAIRKA